MELESKSPCVKVPPRQAEEARRLLKKLGLYNEELKMKRGGSTIALPVVEPVEAVERLRESGVEASPCTGEFETVRRVKRLSSAIKSFRQVGDIAVFSQTHGVPYEEYRKAAEELLAVNPRIRSVWLKRETVGLERVAGLVHLAGDRVTRTIVKEYGVRFYVDISKAYYNPRLASEHHRVAQLVEDGEMVLDMFTGIGGFPLHIATARRALTVGVDLNIDALELAAESLKLNKSRLKGTVVYINADARSLPGILRGVFDRVIMNLPKSSVEFLDAACKLVRNGGVIHVYVISGDESGARRIIEDTMAKHGCTAYIVNVKRVLDYSPGHAIYVVDARVARRGG
ncbi:MAG: class I SAM-dependent methyltransferase family protein [Desulfurococcales archaeon]|nr:class I SAM-dependent methyltransferase family protein [Desulfurococcales archaeon]